MTAIADYFRDFPDAGHEDECRVMLKDLNDRLDKKAFENITRWKIIRRPGSLSGTS